MAESEDRVSDGGDARHGIVTRVAAFTRRFGLDVPLLMAPMAGACPPELAAAVARAGGMGACGALLDPPEAIASWVARFRSLCGAGAAAHDDGGYGRRAPLQLNLWIPDPPPRRDAENEARLRAFLERFGAAVPDDAIERAASPGFAAQCEALLEARPATVSSIMGLFAPEYVARLEAAGIAWFACATTLDEARRAEEAGADAIVAQGAEAGGHRGAFDATRARDDAVGTFSLLPQIVDAVDVPVIATGGVSDARGVAAALVLGASAVQIGTGLLRSDESSVPRAWAEGLAAATPEGTRLTRAFSGRWGRALATDYVRAAAAEDAPVPAPYPVQRALSAAMRRAATDAGDLGRMQAWSGQSAALAATGPADELVARLWRDARTLLGLSAH